MTRRNVHFLCLSNALSIVGNFPAMNNLITNAICLEIVVANGADTVDKLDQAHKFSVDRKIY